MADRGMLARATDGSQAPTPGYLYLDIAKNAGSSPMASQEVAQYLTRRLSSKSNPNIKHKCLKVLAKTAASPITRGHFQRILAQDAQAVSTIKECLQFRGPPDPARGDEPNQKVRTAAKEALDAIYSDTATNSSTSQSSGGMMGAYGGGGIPSTNYGGGAAAAPPGPRRMEGIGNPNFQDPRLQQDSGGYGGVDGTTVNDVLREAGKAIRGMIKDPLARDVPMPPGGGGSRMQGFGSSGGSFNPPGRSALASSTGGQWSMASNRGPNAITGNMDSYHRQKEAQTKAFDWASKNSSGANVSSGGVGGSWGSVPAVGGGGTSIAAGARQPAIPTSTPSTYSGGATTTMTNPAGSGGTASSDGQYEKNLILELCPPGGVKAEPPPEKLLRFQQSIPSLNSDLICPALLDCLEDGQPWIMRGKALCVMRTCIEFGIAASTDGSNKYADFFYECRAEIEPLANHKRPAIRDPAKQVLQLLGIATPVSPSKATVQPQQAAAAPAAPPADLLDFSDPTPVAAPPPAPTPAPPAATAAGSGSLFAGLNTASAPAPPPAEPAAADTTASSGGSSFFGGLTMQGSKDSASSAPPPAQEQQQEATPAAGESLLDAMAPASSGSAFGFMQPSDGPAPASPTQPAAATTTTATSSAFGFMQSEAAAPATETKTETPAAATSAFDFMEAPKPTPMTVPMSPSVKKKPATFDPMAQDYQPSPNAAKKQAMAMMAQQQQAMAMMAQQQQMLMMQQSYQQMQLLASQNKTPTALKQNVMVPHGGGMAATSSFSFLDIGAKPPSEKKEDKKFDFIQDAMKNEQKK